MTEEKQTIDAWALGSLWFWLIIFVMGLFPELVFERLREMSYVVTQRALINSYWFIPLACSGFLGWFTFSRCIEGEEAVDIALGKSVQIVILALTAFLPLRMERALFYFDIPIPFYRYLILSVVALKGLAWFYLIHLLLRYYLVSGHSAFKRIPLVFPSAFFYSYDDKGSDNSAAPEAEENAD